MMDLFLAFAFLMTVLFLGADAGYQRQSQREETGKRVVDQLKQQIKELQGKADALQIDRGSMLNGMDKVADDLKRSEQQVKDLLEAQAKLAGKLDAALAEVETTKRQVIELSSTKGKLEDDLNVAAATRKKLERRYCRAFFKQNRHWRRI